MVVELCERVKESASQSLRELVGFHHTSKVVDSAGPVPGVLSPSVLNGAEERQVRQGRNRMYCLRSEQSAVIPFSAYLQ